MLSELRQSCDGTGVGGFIPAVTQIANVAALPGIVKSSIAMPDVHSGYGFSIGNVAAFDMNDKDAIVSPGGVGFDINCGVRLLRTNLFEGDIKDVKEQVSERERKSMNDKSPSRNVPVLTRSFLAMKYVFSARAESFRSHTRRGWFEGCHTYEPW